MSWLASDLRADGVAVVTPTWRAEDADWATWITTVESAVELARQDAEDGVVLVGQSAGAALCAAIACADQMGEPAGKSTLVLVLVNPMVNPMDPDSLEFLAGRLHRGHRRIPSEPVSFEDRDAVDPDAVDDLDAAGLLAFHAGLADVDFGTVAAITTVMAAANDDVLGRDHLDALRADGRIRRWVEIPGRHVASLDTGRFVVRDQLLSLARSTIPQRLIQSAVSGEE
jgi:acetyl esterase/lipase